MKVCRMFFANFVKILTSVKFDQICQEEVGRYAEICPPLPSWAIGSNKYRSGDVYSAGVIMYSVMSKCVPYNKSLFDDKPEECYIGSAKMKQIYDKMQSTPIKWQHPIWRSLPEAQAFCARLLEFDVEKRYDAEAALRDKWFAHFQIEKSSTCSIC